MHRFYKLKKIFLILIIFIILEPVSFAQNVEKYKVQYINNVQIEGNNTTEESLILKNMEIHKGDKFDKYAIENSLKNIYDIGNFGSQLKAVPIENKDGTINLQIIVRENPPIINLIVEGNDVITKDSILEILEPLKGKPQNIPKINEALRSIEKKYQDEGYILAKIDKVDVEPDGMMYLHIDEGKIANISITGNIKTKKYIIERNILTRKNTIYNEKFLKEDLVRLYATQAFKDVTREVKRSEKDPKKYDINIIVEEDKTREASITGGLDSEMGLFGKVGLEEKNFRGLGQRVSLDVMNSYNAMLNNPATLNRVNFILGVRFFEPHFLNSENSLMANLAYKDLSSYQVPLAIERRIGGEITIANKVKEREHLTRTFSLGVEKINMEEGNESMISNMFAAHNLNISERAKQLEGGLFLSMTPGLVYDSRDSVVHPRNGVYSSLKAKEAFNIQDLGSSFGNATISMKKYFPVGKKSSFSLTAKGGCRAWGNMPEVMAYGLGGPNTIRGFYYNGVGLGDKFMMGSAELAVPVPLLDKLKLQFLDNVRLTFFLDAGKVFNPTVTDVIYDRPMQAVTAGMGVKIYIPGVGPVSIDYGMPFTSIGSNNSPKGYFTFGMGDSMY